jgi:methanol--5-hydroxybenzimidazolylcobamide Co-methyltransferase
MEKYAGLAISNVDDLVFGRCPRPLTLPSGLTIGGGTVYPELNFTLPPMHISAATMPRVLEEYQQMIGEACARAVALHLQGLVVEFELLPDLTLEPAWGAEVTAVLRRTLDQYREHDGLQSALRVTPNDIREFVRPPLLREGDKWERMMASFEQCTLAGADLLSIESTGGKEVHDDALLNGNLPLAVFALGSLACRDMAFLWDHIVAIAKQHGVVAAGDTACGFGNTAMMLADTKHIPKVWAAVIRVMTVARSLVAYERGAVGPGKDCGYENVYLKAITGYPMAMEGAEAACAHLSPVGNIAKATADLWSNESVQNIKLLGGMAPTVSVEQLAYATRLMNVASSQGKALELRDWFVLSDAGLDPQAHVLRPDVAVKLAAQIVAEPTGYLRVRAAAQVTLAELRSAQQNGLFTLSKAETNWLNRLSKQADQLPEDEEELIASVRPEMTRDKVLLDQYGLPA